MYIYELHESPERHAGLSLLTQAVLSLLGEEIKRHYKADDSLFVGNISPVYVNNALPYLSGVQEDIQSFAKETKVFVEIREGNGGSYSGKDIQLNYSPEEVDALHGRLMENPNAGFSIVHSFLKKKESTLLHELTHAFDDWKSRGQYRNNDRSKQVVRHPHASDEAMLAYLRDPVEISARYHEVVSNTPFNRGWEQARDFFTRHFTGWDFIEEKERKRLLSRLYIQWTTMKGKGDNPSLESRFLLWKKRMEDRYGISVMAWIRLAGGIIQLDGFAPDADRKAILSIVRAMKGFALTNKIRIVTSALTDEEARSLSFKKYGKDWVFG